MKTKLFILLSLFFIGSFTACENEIMEDQDPCEQIECLNGGYCLNGSCNCPEGYTGSLCGTNLCANVSCQNGGSCVNGDCECLIGFSGINCQIELNPPIAFSIEEIVLYDFPEFRPNGDCWDDGTCFPDIGFEFWQDNDIIFTTETKSNCRVSEGPYTYDFFTVLNSSPILNHTTLYQIYLKDSELDNYPSSSSDETMLQTTLNLSSIFDDAPYPSALSLTSNSGTLIWRIKGEWLF